MKLERMKLDSPGRGHRHEVGKVGVKLENTIEVGKF